MGSVGAETVAAPFGVLLTRVLPDSALLGACTAVGILGGAAVARVVPPSVARTVMLWCAWAGALVVLSRAVVALLG